MRTVNLDAVEAAGHRVAGRYGEVVDQLANLRLLQALGGFVVVGDVGGRQGWQLRPAAVVDAAVVGQLDER